MEQQERVQAFQKVQGTVGYGKLNGMEVLAVEDGYAKMQLPTVPEVLNPLGKVHGGAISTLCDTTAGTAAASRGRVAVTLSCTINYLRPGEAGVPLIADTREVRYGGKTAVYEVTVRQEEREIAQAVYTMYYGGVKLEELNR